MKTKSSFFNPSLQKISLEAESVISNHLQDLDRISNDIKALEEQLKNSGLPFTFYYILSSDDRRYHGISHQTVNLYEEVPYEAEFIEQTDSCLVWGKCEDGQYRLSHNIYVTDNEIDKYDDGDGHYAERIRNNGTPRLFSSKPLIETKSHFRVKVENELAPFYKGIVEALRTKRDQDCIFEYSLNYNLWPNFSAKIHPSLY
jgi:hypothetical protein